MGGAMPRHGRQGQERRRQEPVARACRKVAAAGCEGGQFPLFSSKLNSPSARKIQTGTLTDSVRNILGTKWGHLIYAERLPQNDHAVGESSTPVVGVFRWRRRL